VFGLQLKGNPVRKCTGSNFAVNVYNTTGCKCSAVSCKSCEHKLEGATTDACRRQWNCFLV